MANPGQLLQEALDSSSSTLIGGGSSLHHPHSNGDHVNGDGPLDSSLDSGVQQPPPHEEEAQDGSLTDHNGYSGGSYDDDGSYNSNGPSDVPRLPSAIEAVLRGVWPFEKALWHSSPASMGATQNNSTQADPPGIMATSSVTGRRAQSQQQLLSNKMEMVYGLLSMFSSGDRADISKTLLAMSSSADSCLALRQSGCLPLLIQLLHGGCDDSDLPSREARLRASQALHNVVHANTDEKRGRREARVLRLLEQIRAYSDYLFERLERTSAGQGPLLEDDMDRHPCPAMAALMKLSFDEEHRLAMCSLGGLHAIAELIKRDHEAHGPTTPDNFCITLRRYAGMALTNLTFGAGNNKTLVCSFSGFLRALVAQLNSPSQDLRQVTSSVIRNLSWRADSTSKQALREAGAVAGLMRAALTATKEATLKVILSAVWNLSAHCSVNKAEICAVEGALAFICNSLTYKSQSRTLAIVENAGGILRNISSHIAVREDLRQVLRDHNTLSVILSQLRSPSLTVVSNACGTLWNLSARCAQDQQTLWDLGAVPMLRSLINSKHKMISMGSSAALKNLLQAKPEGVNLADSKHGLGLPSLQARRQKALEQELDPSLAETCDNIESSPRASPTTVGPDSPFFGGAGVNDGNNVLFNQQMFQSLDPRYGGLMTESRDSIVSNHSSRSDNTHDRAALQHLLSRRTPQQPPCPPGSSNGHRPADLALRNMGHHPAGTDGETSGSSSEHLFGDKSNSAPNTARSGLHPSDPLYNMYSKYVVKNGKKVSASSSSSSGKHPKSEDGKSSLKDKPPVKVNNYVRESSEEVDNVDQPTDFSLRYSETVDDEEVNGSSSQQKPVRRVKPNASHNHEEEFLGADDSVQTYFTEGTPLNFSTATSLSDLRESVGTGVGSSAKLGTQEEEDENLEGASEEDKNGHEEEEDNEEGNLSRFSSMSSISSGEISAGHEHELEEDSDLQELVLAEGERVAAAAAKAAKDSLSPQHTAATNGEERLQQKQDNEQNWSSQATPLMFSRTTSLGSLSSFPQHQPLDDNGSVVSEFSRVASGAVSPSDLPDSPSQTMPSSPRPHKQQQQQQPHPAAAPGARGASSSSQRSGGSNHGVFSDVPHTFNEEGTPCHLSRGTSLSSLTIDDACSSARGSNGSTQPPLTTDRVRGDGKDSSTNTPSPRSSQGAGRGRSIPTPRTSSIPRPQSFAAQDHERSRSSDPHAAAAGGGAGRGAAHRGRTKEKRPSNLSDGDGEKLLAACISSGMPTNRRPSDAPKTPGTASRSSSFIKSPRTPTLGAPVIPPPPPPPPPPRLCGDESGIRGRVSNIPINTVNLQVTTTTLNLAQGVIGDSVRTYCTEDTPANISHAGSVSDLTGDQQSRPRSALKKPSHTPMLQDSADSSDAEGILDRCIQAAMPKMRAIKGKPPSPRHTPSRAAAGKPPAVVASPTSALPRKAGSGTSSPRRAVPVARVSPAIKQCPPPEVISHPSKLSIHKPSSNFNGEEVKNWGEVEGTPLGFSNATSLSDLTVDSSCKGDSGIPRPDAPKRYATEDTPADISRCESLSSLSCDEEGGQITSRLADGGKGQRGAVSRSADSRKRTSMGTGKGDEVPKTFTVEDTPAALSRRSSLSSIDGLESSKQSSMIHTPGEVDKGATSCQVTPGDASAPRNFGVEGTPVNFSRNSSLSSLSVESYPEETTPSEQALLQHCINQGMPKGDRTSRGATPSRGGKKSKTGSRIPGLSHSPGRSPARSPATNIPSVAMSRLQLVNIDTEQRPDHESTKLRSDFEQSEKKQQKSPRVPEEARVRQQSIEDITEVTEPISDTSTLPIAEAARKVSANGSSSSPEDKDKQSSNGGSGGERGGGFSDVSMTDSMIVATEALRVARAVQEGRSSDDASIMSQSITSENLLENIPVPAAMEACVSMSASLTDEIKTPQMQRKAVLECRHTRKGIPAMVRRALGDQERDGNGSASMASSCHSNLDNVVPPSFMEADDMESSMISVASITSEVAESRHSPPSLTSSIPSEAMAAIEGPAQQIARMLQREARQLPSSATMTLTAGEETSTYHEITELDRDDTLGFHDATATDTYHSADDIPPDIPDLPQDSPVHRPGARSSPQVTPSMLRKAVQNSSDKYRTFTKSERRAAVQATGGSSNIGDSRLLSTQQTDRYRARAMSVEGDDDGDMSPVTPTADNPTGSPLQRRSLKEKRNNNPDRYRTRTIESGTPVSPRRPGAKGGEDGLIEFRDGAELDLTAEQLEALSQDANIVICTLNENREANTADLLHGLSQENILDIETLSLISSDEEDNNTYDVEAPRSPAVPGRPRIVKPGEQQPPVEVQEDDDGAGKGIRGRRKGLYPGARKPQTAAKPAQSPVTRPVPTPATAFKPTPRSQQPATQLQTPGSPKAPRATRASELRSKAGRVGSSSSSSPASSAGSSPRMGANARTITTTARTPPQVHSTQPGPGLRRQNTFTKDDLEDGSSSPTPKASAAPSTKPRYRKDTVQPAAGVASRQMSKGSPEQTRSGQSSKSYSLTRDVKPPSASDMADWSKETKSGKTSKKDVTSRIANLWKRVEKAQASSKPKENDSRVWITKASKEKTPTDGQSSPPQLVRSSTYEKLCVNGESRSDTDSSGSKNKTRLGLKLSRLRGRDTKSSPPSEAGTPVTPNGTATHLRRGISDTATTPDGATVKRLSRLGSFVVVDGEEDLDAGSSSTAGGSTKSPQSAVVAPFHYQPPGGASASGPFRSRSNSHSKAAVAGDNTRIPMPSKVIMSNNPRDDNGNAPYV